MKERAVSPCLMLTLWWSGPWLVVVHQAHPFPCTNICVLSSPSPRPNGNLDSLYTSTGPNGDIAVLLAQMVVICMQMRNKLNLVSPLTSCPIKEAPTAQKDCCSTANLSPQINYNEHINHHLFLVQRKISCFSSTSC